MGKYSLHPSGCFILYSIVRIIHTNFYPYPRCICKEVSALKVCYPGVMLIYLKVEKQAQ
jgi:hypothetical protein